MLQANPREKDPLSLAPEDSHGPATPASLIQIAAVIPSAALYAAAFPPNAHRALAWIALAPLFVVLRHAPLRRGLFLAWVWTIALGVCVNDWFPGAVSGYFQQPRAVGLALFFGVSTFTAGLQYMGFAAAWRVLGRFPSVAVPFCAAAAWVAADLFRLLLFGGDPWALLGYSQASVLPIIQVADLTGVHAVTFLAVAVNGALAEAWEVARRRRPTPWRAFGLVALTLFAAIAYGKARLATLARPGSGRVPVGIVQAHLNLGTQWRRDFYGRNLDTYLRLSAEVLRVRPAPRLLIWPENAMTFFLADEPSYRHAIASVIEPSGAQLIAGGPFATEAGGYLNSAFLLSPDGEVVDRYDKQQLLPFAEEFPFGRIDILRRKFGRVREFTPGQERPLLETVVGRVGIMICNEGFFPEPAAARVRAGAGVLVSLANDSWLNAPKFSEPAFEMLTLRAVEQRRWLVRASTAGPSAIVDPTGRVIERTDLFTSATLAGEIEPSAGQTIYCRLGDVFAWACLAATVIAVLLGSKVLPAGQVVRDARCQ